MNKNNPHMRHTHQSCTFYIIHFPLREEFTSCHSGKTRNKYHSQSQYYIIFSRSQNTDKYKSQQNTGKRNHCIVKPHQHLIQPTAEISGKGTDHKTGTSSQNDCGKCHKKSRPGSLHHTAENVPSKLITSEQMEQRRGSKFCRSIHSVRIVRSIKRTDQQKYKHKSCETKTCHKSSAFLLHMCSFLSCLDPNSWIDLCIKHIHGKINQYHHCCNQNNNSLYNRIIAI